MLLKIKIFSILFFHTIISLGQENYIEKYFPLIHKAEMSLIQSEYQNSLQFYEKAFTNVSSPFARDLYNALICSLLVKNKEKVFFYLENLKHKKVPFFLINRIQELNQFKKTKKWKKFVKTFNDYVSPTINMPLKQKLDSLHYKDQYFRKLEGSYKLYEDTIRKIDSQNVKDLVQIIDKFGFPSEDQIGISDSLTESHKFLIVIRHHTPKWMIIYSFTNVLEQAVKQGKISPYVASYLIDFHTAGSENYGYPAIFKCSIDSVIADKKWRYLTSTSQEKINSINNRRAKLGLEPIEEYRQKLVFSLQEKRFLFQLKGTANYLKCNPETVDYFLKNSKEIEIINEYSSNK